MQVSGSMHPSDTAFRALAGSAFESYLEPTGAEGLQQHSLNGSDITFTDA